MHANNYLFFFQSFSLFLFTDALFLLFAKPLLLLLTEPLLLPNELCLNIHSQKTEQLQQHI